MPNYEDSSISAEIRSAMEKKERPILGHILPEGYKLQKFLGAGATSTAYLAQKIGDSHNGFPEYATIKILKPWVLGTTGEPERIEREIKTMTPLNHQNLMKVYGFGIDDSLNPPLVYIIVEYLEGETLDNFLSNVSRSSFNIYYQILIQIILGIKYLHSKGIIHRDIKPENIVVTNKENKLHVKILDFGVIRNLTDDTLTASAYFLGTLRYSSPEWIKGIGDLPAIDIYSVGALIYRMLEGVDPFSHLGINRAMIENAILSGETLFIEIPRGIKHLLDNQEEKRMFLYSLGRYLTIGDPTLRPNILKLVEIITSGTKSGWWLNMLTNDLNEYLVQQPDIIGNSNEDFRKVMNRSLSQKIINQTTLNIIATKITPKIFSEINRFINTQSWNNIELAKIAISFIHGQGINNCRCRTFFIDYVRGKDFLVQVFRMQGFISCDGLVSIASAIENSFRRDLIKELFNSVSYSMANANGKNYGEAAYLDWWQDYFDPALKCSIASCFTDDIELIKYFLAKSIYYYEESLLKEAGTEDDPRYKSIPAELLERKKELLAMDSSLKDEKLVINPHLLIEIIKNFEKRLPDLGIPIIWDTYYFY